MDRESSPQEHSPEQVTSAVPPFLASYLRQPGGLVADLRRAQRRQLLHQVAVVGQRPCQSGKLRPPCWRHHS